MTGPAAAAAAAAAAATHNLASVPPWRLSTTVTRARRPADSSLTNTGHLPPPGGIHPIRKLPSRKSGPGPNLNPNPNLI